MKVNLSIDLIKIKNLKAKYPKQHLIYQKVKLTTTKTAIIVLLPKSSLNGNTVFSLYW